MMPINTYFLSDYYRDNYNDALKNLPIINSGINITRIEVWVTNKTSNFDESQKYRRIHRPGRTPALFG